jgi:hypothetical protein
MVEVGREYIEEVFDDMLSLVGIKEDISSASLKNIFFSKGGVKKCVKKIAEHLGLPIEVNIFYVSPGFCAGGHEANNQFTTAQLVKTDGSGHSKEGITAQVIIPSYVPLFGSKELEGLLVNVKLSKNVGENPDTFFAIMAHELFHVVMHSLRLIKKDNEIYTDIGVMLSGFNKIMKEGRNVKKQHVDFDKIITETTKYGYLSDSDFWFVNHKINNLLTENKKKKKYILYQLDYFQRQIADLIKNVSKVKKYIKFLDQNLQNKINKKDLEKIILFHQPNYFEQIEMGIKPIEDKIQKNDRIIQSMNHYYKNVFKNIEDELAVIKNTVEENKEIINSAAQTCGRNISLIDRIKLYFN